MFDATKRQASIIAGGAILGLAGFGCFVAAAVIALREYVSTPVAALIVGSVLLVAAGAFFVVATRQKRTIADDFGDAKQQILTAISDVKDATIDKVTHAPYNALNDIVDKRPITSMAVAIAAGFAVAKDPSMLTSGVNRLINRLIV